GQGAQAACAGAVGGGLKVSCASGGGDDSVTVTASVDIPQLVPGWSFGAAHKTATMPLDH
ncbi:pilus assembly protein, partial [Streptomyces sp. SID4985]|nr:pilus assembly protein [Streptomyces sp. SID4985]